MLGEMLSTIVDCIIVMKEESGEKKVRLVFVVVLGGIRAK